MYPLPQYKKAWFFFLKKKKKDLLQGIDLCHCRGWLGKSKTHSAGSQEG